MSGELGKCTVCGENATALYPLLPGEPKFCNDHHNPRDAGPFGCDFTGPDDFDIPVDFDDEIGLDRDNFVWKDKEGTEHPLSTIDDRYLQNIINFLKRKLSVLPVPKVGLANTDREEYWLQTLVEFLEVEQKVRCLVESERAR